MEDHYRDKSDIEELVDMADPFADFLSNKFVPQSVRDEKSPESQSSKRKPERASSTESQWSETKPRKRSSPWSIPQAVSSRFDYIVSCLFQCIVCTRPSIIIMNPRDTVFNDHHAGNPYSFHMW